MARVMLVASDFPHSFWGEAVSNAAYTLNRVVFRPGTTKTPYEIWKEKKPNVAHLKVFGSACYIYRDREYLTKFDAKCDRGVFLGYATNSRAYRVYNKHSCKVMETMNVAIDENPSCPYSEQQLAVSTPSHEGSTNAQPPTEDRDVPLEGESSGRIDETLVSQPLHRPGKKQV